MEHVLQPTLNKERKFFPPPDRLHLPEHCARLLGAVARPGGYWLSAPSRAETHVLGVGPPQLPTHPFRCHRHVSFKQWPCSGDTVLALQNGRQGLPCSPALPPGLPAREPAESGRPPAHPPSLTSALAANLLTPAGAAGWAWAVAHGAATRLLGRPRHAAPPPARSRQRSRWAGPGAPAVLPRRSARPPQPTWGSPAHPDFPADAFFPRCIAPSPGGLSTGWWETRPWAPRARAASARSGCQAAVSTVKGADILGQRPQESKPFTRSPYLCSLPHTPSCWSQHVALSRLPASFSAGLRGWNHRNARSKARGGSRGPAIAPFRLQVNQRSWPLEDLPRQLLLH